MNFKGPGKATYKNYLCDLEKKINGEDGKPKLTAKAAALEIFDWALKKGREMPDRRETFANGLLKARTRAKKRKEIDGIEKNDSRRALTAKEEAILLGVLLAMASRGTDVTRPLVITTASDAFGKNFGRKWAKSFLYRHRKHLKFSTAKATTANRTQPQTFGNVEEFIERFKHLQKEGGVKILDDGSNLFNVDETLLNISRDGDIRMLRMTSALRKAHQKKHMRFNTVGSMLPFVSASGEVPFIALVIKAEEGSSSSFRSNVRELAKEARSAVRHAIFHLINAFIANSGRRKMIRKSSISSQKAATLMQRHGLRS